MDRISSGENGIPDVKCRTFAPVPIGGQKDGAMGHHHSLKLSRRSLSFLFWILLSGCNALGIAPAEKLESPGKEQALTTPGKQSYRLSQFVFLADFNLDTNSILFHELAELPEQIHRDLDLPLTDRLIRIYLFEDRQRYEQYMQAKYPNLPKRRAFFVAQPHAVGGAEELLVYTFWGEKIRGDLRHELTHAILHSVLKDVPLWLDEGLAEYYEVVPQNQGLNQQHLEQLRGVGGEAFEPDLARLEQLSQVQQMSPAEYREAWAWVHLMMHDNLEARAALTAYLRQLRSTPNPGPLKPKLVEIFPNLESAFDAHLAKLNSQPAPDLARQR
jgi:hypothetical protein